MNTRNAQIGRSVSPTTLYDRLTWSIMVLVRSYRTFRTTRRQYRELQELPDYLLEDVGLERHQVTKAQRDHQFEFHWTYWP